MQARPVRLSSASRRPFSLGWRRPRQALVRLLAWTALVAVGHPVAGRQYTKLSRKPVEEFAFRDRFDRPW